MSLRKHYVLFLNHLDVESVLPFLLSDGLLTMTEYDKLQNPTLLNKTDQLLRLLPHKGPHFYDKFCMCIGKSGQTELLKMIGFEIPESLMDNVPTVKPSFQPVASSTQTATPTTHQLITPITSQIATPIDTPTPQFTTAHFNPTSIPSTAQTTPIITKHIFILYSKDTQLQTTPTLSSHFHRSSDQYLKEVSDLVEMLDHFSLVPSKAGGAPVRAYTCTYDVFECQKDLIQNFLLWSEKELQKSNLVLLLCSPQMKAVLSGDVPYLEMEKGQATAHSLINILSDKRVIPVYLNMPKIIEWLPSSLKTTPTYTLNIQALQEAVGEISSYEELSRRAFTVLSEERPELRDFNDLIRILRQEEAPPLSDVVITMPPVKGPVVDDSIIQMIVPKVQFKWTRLGLKLGFTFMELECIRTECSDNLKKSTNNMLKEWQTREGASLEKLIAALEHIEFAAVANKLKQMKL